MPDTISAERAAICDLLASLGPDQPTLCHGWLTRDLAAHLVLRERRPGAAAGIAIRPLAGHTARVQHALASRPYDALVTTLRTPPWWTRPGAVQRAINTLELFVHHEDIRRARPAWQPRQVLDIERALWRRIAALARRLRKFPGALVIEAPEHGTIRTGAGEAEVRLRGAPGELTMFLTGRKDAAQVELAGPEGLTDLLTSARLNL